MGTVESADPALNTLSLRTVDGREETLRYDQLIVALGSVSRVLPVPGLAEHGLGFKTLADAIALRNRALLCLEIAESLPGEDERREYLTFVFVGAGYAGLEGVAELQDFVADVIDRYPRCRLDGRALHARGGARAGDARDPREPGPVRGPRAAGPRDRAANRHDAQLDRRALRRAVDRRADLDPLGLLDGRSEARTGRGPARPAARPTRAHRGRADHAREGARERLGHRRRRRGARPRPAPARTLAAHRAARHPPGPAGGRERGRHARRAGARSRSATARSACSWTWASTRRWPRCSASRCAASRPGSPRAPTT